MTIFDVAWVREQFPGLAHRQNGNAVAFFDGPAGSQVPLCVADSVRRYLLETNSQHGGLFEVSRASRLIYKKRNRAQQATTGRRGTGKLPRNPDVCLEILLFRGYVHDS